MDNSVSLMTGRIRSFGVIFALLLAVGCVVAGVRVDAQEVVTLSQSSGDRRISVTMDQAIVVQSAEPFADVSIAQPEIADIEALSSTSLYLYGRRRGRTTLTLIGPEGRLIANLTVVVESETGELKQRLSELLPRERVTVSSLGDGVVLSGEMTGAREVDQAMAMARAYAGDNVTNMMSVGGGQQVSLKVRIAEMNRSAAKELGIGLGVADGSGSTILQGGSGNIVTDLDGSAIFAIQRSGFGAIDAVVSVSDSLLLAASIEALESKGLARMLAEPTLVALSGGEAEFLAGGEVPVPTVNDDGDVDVEYRPVGVSLGFRPVVVARDKINISVSSEVSSIDANLGTTVGSQRLQGFSVRRATTQVELRDGQSFAIAGLYQDDFSDGVDQVPILGDIPILGALFRSARYRRNETELVIIVTADLVGPVDDARRLPDPLRRMPIPNERELFLFGNVSGRGQGVPAFDGPFGYAVK